MGESGVKKLVTMQTVTHFVAGPGTGETRNRETGHAHRTKEEPAKQRHRESHPVSEREDAGREGRSAKREPQRSSSATPARGKHLEEARTRTRGPRIERDCEMQ